MCQRYRRNETHSFYRFYRLSSSFNLVDQFSKETSAFRVAVKKKEERRKGEERREKVERRRETKSRSSVLARVYFSTLRIVAFARETTPALGPSSRTILDAML